MKKLTILEAESLAGKFRSEIGLSQYEPVNAKTLLRKLNITTMYRPLSENSISADESLLYKLRASPINICPTTESARIPNLISCLPVTGLV